MTHEKLPAGWVSAALSEVADINPGSFSKPPQDDDPVSFVPMAAVEEESGRLDPSTHRPWLEVKKGYTLFQDDDVLFAKVTPCMENGKAALAARLKGGRGAGSTEFFVLRSRGGVDPKYLMHFVLQSSFRRDARAAMQGVAGLLRVRKEFMQTAQVPVAPLPEQRRIVAEIERQLTRLDAGVEALKRVQAQLKRYRASVLKAACQGRLVPTEAELARREKRDYEPADKLLARILKERRARWEADQLAKMKAAGKPPKDDKWKAKYVEPAGPQISDLGALPEGWQWATVEQLALLVTDGDHNPPKRSPSGVPHLTAKHIKGWSISTAGCTFVSPADFEKTRARYEPTAGDLIVTCVGTVGETAIVPSELTFSADRNLAGIRVVPQGVSVRFLQLALGAPQTLSLLRTVSGSTAQPHLYLGDLRAIVIPVPPTAEQVRILEESDRLLSLYRATAGQVQANLARSGRLRQAVLRRAFEGLLVPQDPREESASKLLENSSAAMDNKPLPRQGRAKQAISVSKMKATR